MSYQVEGSKVIVMEDSDLSYSFDDNGPYIYLKIPDKKNLHYEKVDPFPCYTHDHNLVASLVNQVQKKFPIEPEPYFFILPFEDKGRTNGSATSIGEYVNDKYVQNPIIILSGKRICLHPCMTRYLVGHEYGHQVDSFICKRRGYEDGDPTEFDRLYAKMRGIDLSVKYGSRNWHTNIGEIIANDFRVCVMGWEKEFWPHPCKHPDECPNVHEFWSDLMLEYGYK